MESCLALLRRGDLDSMRRAEVLCCMGALLAHRRVAETLADADPSLACVLATPINLHTAGTQELTVPDHQAVLRIVQMHAVERCPVDCGLSEQVLDDMRSLFPLPQHLNGSAIPPPLLHGLRI